jgi:hypothetical protein
LIERSSVDLPQPEGPMKAVTERGSISRSTSKSACLAPYQKENFRATMVPGTCPAAPAGAPPAAGRTAAAVIRTAR